MKVQALKLWAGVFALSLVVVAGMFLLTGTVAHAAPPATVQAALADPARPAEDVARDVARKPAELVAFAGIKPGDTVIDFLPGGGYFTMVFSGVVGAKGHVYAMVPKVAEAYEAPQTAKFAPFMASHANVSLVIAPSLSLGVDKPVDVFWTAQNYHDLHIPFGGASKPQDMGPYNKAVWAALKPGGTYIVVDHVANAGATDEDVKKLHRIDPAVIVREVEAAGFKLEGRSDVLHNPADPHTANVFDPSIRGHTDQVALKFRKVG